jgi:hypothetical protein
MRYEWTAVDMCFTPFDLILCLHEREYEEVMKRLKLNNGSWIGGNSSATTHRLVSPDNKRCFIVCLDVKDYHTPTYIAGVLVHEAVHVWQWYCEQHGEDTPASEQEAYGIQRITKVLMDLYVSRLTQGET